MNFEFMTIDTPLPPCMPFPRALTGFPVSSTAKVMYCRMLDAMLSKGQEDENGILFVCFPVTAIAAVLSRSPMTVKRSLNELENAGLMQSILDAINEWIKEILIGAINGNLSTMFGDVNEKVGTIAAEVGQTPQGWNANIFSMIQTLSENVIVPIAGLVITYVLCYELISMVTEKNNMHDVDTSMFFKWVFKAFVAVYLVTHTFDITMAVFDMAQHVVSGAAGVIGGSTEIDVAAALASMQSGLDAMEIPELLLLVMETSLVSLCMKIMSVLITVILYGRMIEIYLYCSVSPIPFATMTNREWGQIGNNYLKSLFAIGFQGFLIMICVGIYAVLVNNMIIADNLHSAIFSLAAYTVILCFSLFKSGALAKSIFSAH